MASWKKLIFSGSNAEFNSLFIGNAVTASVYRAQNGVGTPTLISPSNIILSASNAVVLKDGTLRLASFTNAETSSLTPSEGDIIFNSTVGKVLIYSGSEWKYSLLEGDAANLPQNIVSSSTQISDYGFISSSDFPFTGSAIFSGSVEVTGSVNITGSLTATSFNAVNGVGTPTITSGNSIILSGSEAVILKDLALRLEAFTNAETGSLTSQDGDLIYNSDRERVLMYSSSIWHNVLIEGDDAGGEGVGFPFTGSATITGSLSVDGPVTASYFKGDGSQLTNVTFDQAATLSDSFTGKTEYTVTHNFGTRNIMVNVYDTNYEYFIPEKIKTVDENNVLLSFASSSSGTVVIARGGHLMSGSLPVDEITTLVDNITGVTAHTASHNFNTSNVLVQVYDNEDVLKVPSRVKIIDVDNVGLDFTSSFTGTVVVAKGGHVVSASADNSAQLEGQPGSYYLDYDNFTNIPSSIISSSTQITELGNITLGGDLLPQLNETYDLGSNSQRWKDLYLSGSTIYLDTTRLTRTSQGDLEIKDHTNNRKNLLLSQIHIGDGSSDLIFSQHDNNSLLLHHSGSSDALTLIATASHAQTASYALNAAGTGFPFSGSASITGSLEIDGYYYGDGSRLTGVIASIAEEATLIDNFINATSHVATHNFGTKNVLVQVFNSDDEVIIPSSIVATNINSVRVAFPEPLTGRVIVAKGGHIVSGSGGGGGGGGASSAGILMHRQTLTTEIDVPDNYNALLISPVSLGTTVSVGSGAELNIISH